MATDSAPWAWARQPSVFLAAALSTKVRSVASLTLLVRRAPPRPMSPKDVTSLGVDCDNGGDGTRLHDRDEFLCR